MRNHHSSQWLHHFLFQPIMRKCSKTTIFLKLKTNRKNTEKCWKRKAGEQKAKLRKVNLFSFFNSLNQKSFPSEELQLCPDVDPLSSWEGQAVGDEVLGQQAGPGAHLELTVWNSLPCLLQSTLWTQLFSLSASIWKRLGNIALNYRGKAKIQIRKRWRSIKQTNQQPYLLSTFHVPEPWSDCGDT